jgi:anti-sigma-K factor RskA
MTHDEARELLGLYALGALEAADVAGLSAHLARCAACREEAAAFAADAAELARAAPEVDPSPALTRRILAAPARSHGEPSAQRLRWRVLPVLGGLGIAAVLGGLVVSHWMLRGRLERALATIAQGRDLLEFIASANVRTTRLASDHLPQARAFVSYDHGSGRLVVIAFGMPAPPPGHVYQLWAISDGIHPAAVLSGAAGGGALMRDRATAAQDEGPLFAITLEPAPGAAEPTGSIVLMSIPPTRGG